MSEQVETSEERVARYIRQAAGARDLASKSQPLETKEACLSMAESWLAMALDAEERGSARAVPRNSRRISVGHGRSEASA